jgi:hypothetical protein
MKKEVIIKGALYEKYLRLIQKDGLRWYEAAARVLALPQSCILLVRDGGTNSQPKNWVHITIEEI